MFVTAPRTRLCISRIPSQSMTWCRRSSRIAGFGSQVVSAAGSPHGRRRLAPGVQVGQQTSPESRYLAPFSSQAISESNGEDSDVIPEEEMPTNSPVRVISIADGGGSLTLGFANRKLRYTDANPDLFQESTFHASWLWSNDPKRVMLPSGQRTSTPGQWRVNQQKIAEAKIVYCKITEPNCEKEMDVHVPICGASNSMETIRVPGPTLKDSCHPLAIYGKYPPWVTTTKYLNNFESDGEKNNTRPYLQITWTSSLDESNEDEISYFDIQWLQRFKYDNSTRRHHRKHTEVQPIHAIRRNGPPLWQADCRKEQSSSVLTSASQQGEDGLIHLKYDSIIDSNGEIIQNGLLGLLHAVFRDGAAIVSNAPIDLANGTTIKSNTNTSSSDNNIIESMDEEQLPVAKLAKAMSGGALSHGALYGNIFHVRVGERNSNNVAYTSSSLCPHQDLVYYESPPGMQLLHCVAMGKGVVGGESTLMDALAAAYRLRELRPESFECLVRCPATFVKQRNGASMTYRRPHIVLAEDGRVSGGSIDREIVAVYWSPPFEGPVTLPPCDVDRYYEAYSDFERILDVSEKDSIGSEGDELSRYARDFTWERKLAPGEVLVFNNRRMLHGRRAFSAAEGLSLEDSQRHLIGCYTSIDDTLNCYRVHLRDTMLQDIDEAGFEPSILNVGNSTNIIP